MPTASILIRGKHGRAYNVLAWTLDDTDNLVYIVDERCDEISEGIFFANQELCSYFAYFYDAVPQVNYMYTLWRRDMPKKSAIGHNRICKFTTGAKAMNRISVRKNDRVSVRTIRGGFTVSSAAYAYMKYSAKAGA